MEKSEGKIQKKYLKKQWLKLSKADENYKPTISNSLMSSEHKKQNKIKQNQTRNKLFKILKATKEKKVMSYSEKQNYRWQRISQWRGCKCGNRRAPS